MECGPPERTGSVRAGKDRGMRLKMRLVWRFGGKEQFRRSGNNQAENNGFWGWYLGSRTKKDEIILSIHFLSSALLDVINSSEENKETERLIRNAKYQMRRVI